MNVNVEKTSLVLVIRPFSHNADPKFNNIERFLRIGMVSYEKYMDKTSIQDFFVVVPSVDVEPIKKLLTDRYPSWPWKVLNEDALLHSALPAGWARQQTVKFAVSMLIQTDTYFIIDDDTYLTKPFTSKDLKDPQSGRLIMNRTKIDFPFFFLWSCQVLKYDFEKVQDCPYHMAITPEVFVTSVVKDIVKWLIAEYGNQKQWQVYIVNNKFTEYCVYWIWLLKENLIQTYYAVDTPKTIYGYATTGPEHNLSQQVARSFTQNTDFWFSFVQSSLPYPVQEICDVVLRYLQ